MGKATANVDIGTSGCARSRAGFLFATVVMVVLGPACATSAPPVQFSSDLFDKHEVLTGAGTRQTVVPGFFLGGSTAELAVVEHTHGAATRLRMYGFDAGEWGPVVEAKLGAAVLFVDVANIDGRDRLITFANGRVNWFDPESGYESALVEVAASFRPNEAAGIPHVDVTRDLNHDGRDDLVLPGCRWLLDIHQVSDGAFADP